MKISNLKFPEVLILEPKIYYDDRGFFYESFNHKIFSRIVNKKINFVQDNLSCSNQGVLRGLHYQIFPYEQEKLVQVLNGSIYEVIVDIRKESKTYNQWTGVNLTKENKKQVWVPKGFAHGFISLENNTLVSYKVTNYYSKKHERVIFYNDQNIDINWPYDGRIKLSERDTSK